MELHGVELTKEARTIINTSYKKGDKVSYLDALVILSIDQETQTSWTVRGNRRDDDTKSVKSNISRALSEMRSNTRGIKYRNGNLLSNLKTTISKKEVADTYGLAQDDAKPHQTSIQKSRKSMPETIILEEASPDDTMIRKSTIDFPRYTK